MKRYTITVNGNAYDVTVDEADGITAAPAAAQSGGRRGWQRFHKRTHARHYRGCKSQGRR